MSTDRANLIIGPARQAKPCVDKASALYHPLVSILDVNLLLLEQIKSAAHYCTLFESLYILFYPPHVSPCLCVEVSSFSV